MSFHSRHFIRALTAGVLIPLFTAPPGVFAQAPADHIVSPEQMQNAAVSASEARQQNIDALNRFFSSEKAQQALRGSHIDPQQVKSAVAILSDAELAQMATRAQMAQQKFAAGTMSDHDLLIILVAIAVIVLIIVAVR
jgi:hypothetical protein